MSHAGKQRIAILKRASIGIVVAIFGMFPALVSYAVSPPNIVTYQGRLLDANGVPVTSASVSMIFELYTDPTAGSCVWSNSSASCASATARTVTLTDGLFSEDLGDTSMITAYAAIGDDIFADNAALYLRVTVAGEALSPRKRLTAAPYALNSETLDGYSSSLTGGTSSFVPVTDSDGNLTLTGDPESGNGPFYINPASASASAEIFSVAENGSIYFRVLGSGQARFDNEVSIGTNPSDQVRLNIFKTASSGGQNESLVEASMTIGGDYNTAANEIVQGYDSTITLADSVATDQINHIANFYGAFAHNGDGTTDNWRGLELSLTGTNGTLGQGRGVEVSIDSTATDNAYGGFFDVTNATSNNIALYTGRGAVYIDGRQTPLQSSPGNFTASNGDLYVVGESEFDDSAYFDGNTTFGNAASDTITLTGTLQGATALKFEGATTNDYITNFALPDPTASDNTITFQNGSGTVAFTSDIPAGASLWAVGANGTYEEDAAVIVGADAAFTYVNLASAGDLGVSGEFEVLGSGFFGGNAVVGATTSSAETLGNAGFSLGGDDLFVAGTLGVEGNLYTDGSLILGSTTTISDGSLDSSGTLSLNTTNNQNINIGTGGFDVGGRAAIGGSASVGALDTLTLTESLACTSDCSSIQSSLTNTTNAFTTEVVGGDFTSASAVASGAAGRLIGLSGTASTTGAVVHAGSISGVRGRVAATAASTWADVDGLFGEITLNGIADVDRAAAVNGSLLYNASPGTLTGSLNLFYGNFGPSVAATIETFIGLELGLEGTAGTINNAQGISVSMDSSQGLTLNSVNTPSGIGVTMNTAQTGNDPTIYGVNVSATTGADGTTAAYGVRSTATGGDTNFAGYFYGSLVQIDVDENPDNNMQLISAIDGPGDLYVTRNFEVDGDGRFDGGDLTLTSTGDVNFEATTSSATGKAIASLRTDDGGGTGGDWQMYTMGGETALAPAGNGAQGDLRWAIDAVINNNGDVMRLTRTGDLFVDTATNNGGADVAEVYQVADLSLGAGDVVALTSSGDLISGTPENGALFGVVSTRPGVVLNNGTNDTFDPDERWIALSGRVPVKVNLEGGAIAPGDPITSSSTPGKAKKAQGPGMILGFALESYTGSESPIEMFMSLQWNSVGKIAMDGSAVGVNADLVVNALSDASASDTAVDSSSLVLRGSAFDIVASDRDFSIRTSVTNATDYRLSIKNAVDAEVAYIDQDGGFSVAGDVIVGDHLYPSDRGVPQTNRYIFYDGSSGPGGDFMRTNASGWATGSYDFAEMFPSSQTLEPGDVVVFAPQKESVERGDSASRERIAGVVSTRPGFLAGENTPGSYPIALAGRVPTRVSNEGGEIKVGDALTVSSVSGVAKKAQESGMILGYALENFSGTSGKIVAFINATYWNGLLVSAKNSASGLGGASLSSLDLSGNLYIGANDILNVGSISGMGMLWEISSDGNIRTRGTLATTIEAYNGDLVDTFATTSPDVHVTLSGTAELENGRATVNLVKEHANFLSVVSNMTPLRILASPNAAVAVYITNRKDGKFDIVQVGGASSGVLVDWYVIGTRKDFEREEDLVIEVPDEEEPEVEETDLIPETPVALETPASAEATAGRPEARIPEEASVEPPEAEPVVEIAEPEVEPVVEITEPIAEPESEQDMEAPQAPQELQTPETEEVVEVVEVVEAAEAVEAAETAEPASGREPPEPEQIPSDSSHDDAGVASEGSEE